MVRSARFVGVGMSVMMTNSARAEVLSAAATRAMFLNCMVAEFVVVISERLKMGSECWGFKVQSRKGWKERLECRGKSPDAWGIAVLELYFMPG